MADEHPIWCPPWCTGEHVYDEAFHGSAKSMVRGLDHATVSVYAQRADGDADYPAERTVCLELDGLNPAHLPPAAARELADHLIRAAAMAEMTA